MEMSVAIAILNIGSPHSGRRGPRSPEHKPASSTLHHPSGVVLGKLDPVGEASASVRPSSQLMELLKEALLGLDIGRRCNGVELPATTDQTRDIDKLFLRGKILGCARLRHDLTGPIAIQGHPNTNE